MFKVFLISQWKDMSCALQSVLLPCCQILPWVKFVPFIPIQRCSPFGLSFCFSPIKCLRLSYNSYLHLSLFFRGSRVLFQFLTVGFISHTTGILYMTGFFFKRLALKKEKDKKKKKIKKQSFPALLLKICLDFIIVFKLNWSAHLEAFNYHNLIFKSPF